ncbi:hypothetical protein RCL_jg12859.t1 [Rhizophagus clarus]|uniref:Uncharacterized protein n=1 Tax=Rhizophagus clarus TaxID=94130 RepID=A0A8H3KTP7_9GLOM|nr:hypothetical protein RCL_jg12859.t1 [Rhizophagus clarus]
MRGSALFNIVQLTRSGFIIENFRLLNKPYNVATKKRNTVRPRYTYVIYPTIIVKLHRKDWKIQNRLS